MRFRHEAIVAPILIGVKKWVFHPHGVVHKPSKALIVALSSLSEALVVAPLVIWHLALVISPLIILVGILPLVVLIPHLAGLVWIVAPLVRLIGVVSPLVLVWILPLVVLVVAPLAPLVVRIEPLVRIIVEALPLTLVTPHSCKNY